MSRYSKGTEVAGFAWQPSAAGALVGSCLGLLTGLLFGGWLASGEGAGAGSVLTMPLVGFGFGFLIGSSTGIAVTIIASNTGTMLHWFPTAVLALFFAIAPVALAEALVGHGLLGIWIRLAIGPAIALGLLLGPVSDRMFRPVPGSRWDRSSRVEDLDADEDPDAQRA